MSEGAAKYYSVVDEKLSNTYDRWIAAIREGAAKKEIRRLKQLMIDAGNSGD
jgi:putative component of toxin-antitoxin plasmid stabilization module